MNLLESDFRGIAVLLVATSLLSCSSLPKKEQRPLLNKHVLFVPGLSFKMGNRCEAKDFEEWKDLNELFTKNGFSLKVACLQPSGTIEEGAKALSEEIERLFPVKDKQTFHIIAKSMGGLSVRLMLYNKFSAGQSLSDQVQSVTTISTPHKGSEIADMLMEGKFCTLPGKVFLPVINKFTDVVTTPLLNLIGLKTDGLDKAGEALTTKYMKCFNAVVKNDPNIKYFSFGYAIKCDQDCQSKRTLTYPAPF